jgi:predicted O-methyltransferase YrrM
MYKKQYLSSIKGLDIDESIVGDEFGTLLDLFLQYGKKDCVFVEIGTWKGKSTSALAFVALLNNGMVYAVDHFMGNSGQWNVPVAKNQDIFNIFRKNMQTLGFWQTSVSPLVMSSERAAKIFKDETIDLLFIDGDHLFKNFYQELTIWYPKVKDGGVICGHDCEQYYYSNLDIIKDCEENINLDFGIGKRCKTHLHYGVVKGVALFFGDGNYEILPKTSIWKTIKNKEKI